MHSNGMWETTSRNLADSPGLAECGCWHVLDRLGWQAFCNTVKQAKGREVRTTNKLTSNIESTAIVQGLARLLVDQHRPKEKYNALATLGTTKLLRTICPHFSWNVRNTAPACQQTRFGLPEIYACDLARRKAAQRWPLSRDPLIQGQLTPYLFMRARPS